MDIDYTAMFSQLEQQVIALAEGTVSDYRTQAVADATQIVNDMKADLVSWGTELAAGKISTDDLQLLVNNGKTLMTLTALEQAGLAQIRLNQFLSSLLTIIYNTLVSFINNLTKTA